MTERPRFVEETSLVVCFLLGSPASSVVRCPSSVVRRQQFLYTPFPPKLLGQFIPNLSGMFLGMSSLFTVFTVLDFIKNSGCHGNEIDFLSNYLKIFFSETAVPILK